MHSVDQDGQFETIYVGMEATMRAWKGPQFFSLQFYLSAVRIHRMSSVLFKGSSTNSLQIKEAMWHSVPKRR